MFDFLIDIPVYAVIPLGLLIGGLIAHIDFYFMNKRIDREIRQKNKL